MGKQQDLKYLGEKMKAPSIQIFYLERGNAAFWLMSKGRLEEKNTMLMYPASKAVGPFLCWVPGLLFQMPVCESIWKTSPNLCWPLCACWIRLRGNSLSWYHTTLSATGTAQQSMTRSFDNNWPSSSPKCITKALVDFGNRNVQCNILPTYDSLQI